MSLSEAGMSHIKQLTLDQPRKKRKKVSTGAEAEARILDAIEAVVANSVSGLGELQLQQPEYSNPWNLLVEHETNLVFFIFADPQQRKDFETSFEASEKGIT